jgi:4-alpha-glucanotransferase
MKRDANIGASHPLGATLGGGGANFIMVYPSPHTTVGSPGFGRRSSGVLLPLSSLPGRHGSGDLSEAAFAFIDFLAAAGQSWWQMLPVGPPGDPPGNSPYSPSSSVAGSPYLVSLDTLWKEGWLTRREIQPERTFLADHVCFEVVHPYREQRLRLAWERFRMARPSRRAEFVWFCEQHRDWLDDFALYSALKRQLGQTHWTAWPRDLRCRRPAALAEMRRSSQVEFDFHRWVQFQFHRQWAALRRHARRRRVALIGDIPIFVSHDSADVWTHTALFKLDASGLPTQVSGYPPDDFCPQGQRWGHPQYHWPEHQRTEFGWWAARFAGAYRLFDAVRLDHFLGFTRLWSIPARTRGAKYGRWIRTPGRALLSVVRQTAGNRPMIAEDLGHVTPADVRLRDDLGIPAMRILQWGLGPGDPQHRPHRFSPHTVAYTGTHDTDTAVGWFQTLDPRARNQVLNYTGADGREIHLALIRLAWNSVANTVIVPVQDLLGLDHHARMNRPGTPTKNWHWRILNGQLSPELAHWLHRLTELSERLPESETNST